MIAAAQTQAAVVLFTATAFTDESQISTKGTLVEASNIASAVSVDLNGVTFVGSNTVKYTDPGGIYTNASVYTGPIITGLTEAETTNLLDSLEYGSGTGNSTITLTGLTIGNDYEIQLLASDMRTSTKTSNIGYAETIGGAEVYTPALNVNLGSTGGAHIITGYFTATETSQEIHLSDSLGENAEFCALQLRVNVSFSGENAYGITPEIFAWIIENNPDLPVDFITESNTETRILVPDGQRIELWQMTQFLNHNFDLEYRPDGGFTEAQKETVLTATLRIRKMMGHPITKRWLESWAGSLQGGEATHMAMRRQVKSLALVQGASTYGLTNGSTIWIGYSSTSWNSGRLGTLAHETFHCWGHPHNGIPYGLGYRFGIGSNEPEYSQYDTIDISSMSIGEFKVDQLGGVLENSANATSVGTVSARNNHGGAALIYTISSGNESGAFAINATTGELTIADSAQLDYEALSNYLEATPTFDLLVDITNTTTPSLNETALVVVSVNDTNEPHSIVGASTANIYKNALEGTEIVAFSTQGEDQSDQIDWAIVSGDTGGAFAINSAGVVTVANATALASQVSHSLQISATDDGPSSPTIVAHHTVTITGLLWDSGNTPFRRNWTQELGVSASQSTTAYGGDASRAIDGNTSGIWSNDSVTHTETSGNNSWWEVDLGAERSIESIVLHNRTDASYETSLSNFRVSILDASRSELAGQNFYEGSGSVATTESWQLLSRVVGRYVRVELLGQNNVGNGVLSLAEVQVFEYNDVNGPWAVQSTTNYGGIAARAIDGNTNGDWSNGSVTHTDSTSDNWFELKLGTRHSLEQIVLHNRTDGSYETSLSNFRVSIWDGATEVYGSDHFTTEGSVGSIFSLSKLDGIVADKVRIELLGNNRNGNKVLSLAEVQVYGIPLNRAPVATDTTLTVTEDAVIGTSVGMVSAWDLDTDDTLSYAITAGNEGGEFVINSASGEITTTGLLDYETNAQYSLSITVSDNGTPTLTDIAIITVDITDVIETPIASTGAPSNLTQTSADLAYSITEDGGEAPTVTIYYGKINGGTSAGAWGSSASQAARVIGSYNAAISGLTENTTYYYTVHASNSGGEVWGSTGSFTTVKDLSPKLVRTTVSAVSNTSWTTVDLGKNYNSAVIVATPIYPNTSVPPVVTRITNVSGSTFDLKIDRADGLTASVSVDVSVVVVEEGVYTQAIDGVTMEAVKFTSTVTAQNNSWVAEARTYQNNYTAPVVVGQVMSANDANWSVFWSMGSSRTNPADASNLNVGKHVAEDTNTTRADETIGYIVIESGSGTINGIAYEAALGADTVRGIGNSSTPYTYSLNGGLNSVSSAAASVSGMDGPDGSWAVISGSPALTTASIGLHAMEDLINDTEQNHTTTQVSYIVFE